MRVFLIISAIIVSTLVAPARDAAAVEMQTILNDTFEAGNTWTISAGVQYDIGAAPDRTGKTFHV